MTHPSCPTSSSTFTPLFSHLTPQYLSCKLFIYCLLWQQLFCFISHKLTCMNNFFFVCFSPRHKSLDRAVECPSYILSGGVRKGCNFSGKPLPEFTDIYFCVNGSSREGPLKATFFSLQIQNQGVYMAAAMQALW